jgi:hypothetical protein
MKTLQVPEEINKAVEKIENILLNSKVHPAEVACYVGFQLHDLGTKCSSKEIGDIMMLFGENLMVGVYNSGDLL